MSMYLVRLDQVIPSLLDRGQVGEYYRIQFDLVYSHHYSLLSTYLRDPTLRIPSMIRAVCNVLDRDLLE